MQDNQILIPKLNHPLHLFLTMEKYKWCFLKSAPLVSLSVRYTTSLNYADFCLIRKCYGQINYESTLKIWGQSYKNFYTLGRCIFSIFPNYELCVACVRVTFNDLNSGHIGMHKSKAYILRIGKDLLIYWSGNV